MNCQICSAESKEVFQKTVLSKYEVKYYECQSCQFVQTESPYWLNDAYENAITNLDIGLVQRNISLRPIVYLLLSSYFNRNGRYLDYGGGYGMLVRMMRDSGFDYFRQDIYCDNLMSKSFDVADLKEEQRNFDLLTAFEVFEHLPDVNESMNEMLKFSNNVFFSTMLRPDSIEDMKDWWYISAETGQHVAFYSKKSLEILAKKYGLTCYTNNRDLHFLTNKKISTSLFKLITKPKIALAFYLLSRKRSLQQKDYNFLLNLMKNGGTG